jgi:hypothetical protein
MPTPLRRFSMRGKLVVIPDDDGAITLNPRRDEFVDRFYELAESELTIGAIRRFREGQSRFLNNLFS